MNSLRWSGMRGFTLVWIGQVVSLVGSAMTAFALPIWAFELTGSATALALAGFFFITPMLIMSPFAGALVDRSNRKLMMMISDLAAGLSTLAIFGLAAAGRLEIWQIYVANAINGTFHAFQWPAYSAAITTMLPKEQYGRANGMLSLAEAGSGVLAPVMAGALYASVGLPGILLVDIVTFVAAIGALLVVHVPQPARTEAGRRSQGSIWKESVYGFRYIFERPSLLGLQIVFMLGNFCATMAFAISVPLILLRTGGDKQTLGLILTMGAAGGIAGGIIMSAWGGPRRRVHGVLAGWAVSSLFGMLLMGVAQGLVLWAVAMFVAELMVPIINGSNQAIWQAKVAPDVQGRVFATRRLIAWFIIPVATLLAGPLADYVFEPMMQSGGAAASAISGLVGSGPGAGIGLMFAITGLVAMAIALGGYAVPVIRDAEDLLPDYDLSAAAELESTPERSEAAVAT